MLCQQVPAPNQLPTGQCVLSVAFWGKAGAWSCEVCAWMIGMFGLQVCNSWYFRNIVPSPNLFKWWLWFPTPFLEVVPKHCPTYILSEWWLWMRILLRSNPKALWFWFWFWFRSTNYTLNENPKRFPSQTHHQLSFASCHRSTSRKKPNLN